MSETNICRHCGYSWRPRIDDPKKCPACKRLAWRAGSNQRVFVYGNDTDVRECVHRLVTELKRRGE